MMCALCCVTDFCHENSTAVMGGVCSPLVLGGKFSPYCNVECFFFHWVIKSLKVFVCGGGIPSPF